MLTRSIIGKGCFRTDVRRRLQNGNRSSDTLMMINTRGERACSLSSGGTTFSPTIETHAQYRGVNHITSFCCLETLKMRVDPADTVRVRVDDTPFQKGVNLIFWSTILYPVTRACGAAGVPSAGGARSAPLPVGGSRLRHARKGGQASRAITDARLEIFNDPSQQPPSKPHSTNRAGRAPKPRTGV